MEEVKGFAFHHRITLDKLLKISKPDCFHFHNRDDNTVMDISYRCKFFWLLPPWIAIPLKKRVRVVFGPGSYYSPEAFKNVWGILWLSQLLPEMLLTFGGDRTTPDRRLVLIGANQSISFPLLQWGMDILTTLKGLPSKMENWRSHIGMVRKEQ